MPQNLVLHNSVAVESESDKLQGWFDRNRIGPQLQEYRNIPTDVISIGNIMWIFVGIKVMRWKYV